MLEKTFHGLGFAKNKEYAWVGVNAAGKMNVEGLLPESVIAAVHAANTGIVQAATHGTNDEQKSAKSNLKKLYLAEFKAKAKPRDEFYKGFYPLVKLANKALAR